MTWQDHLFKIEKDGHQQNEADNWDVIDAKTSKRRFGGFVRFTYFPFLDKIDFSRHRWAHVHEDGKIVRHDEKQDFSMLKPDMYAFEISLPEDRIAEKEENEAGPEEKTGISTGGKGQGAEDIEGVPLGVAVGLPMWQHNPYIANFLVRRWYAMIATIVTIRLRQFVALYKYKEELLPMRIQQNKQGKDLWEEFWNLLKKDLIQKEGTEQGENIRIYGWEIMKQGAGLIRLDPSKDYREATTREYKAEQERKVTIINADAKGKAIIIEAIANAKAARKSAEQRAIESGLMYGKIVTILADKKFGLSPEKAQELAAEFTKYWKGTEEKAITDWRFSGADGSVLAEIAKIVGVAATSKQTVVERSEKKKSG